MGQSEHRFKPENISKLMSQERYEKIQPEILMDALQIDENEVIADLGSGAGFFTIPLARRTKNKVFAVDIEPQMHIFLKEYAAEQTITNIKTIESNLNVIPLESNQVDKLLAAFVLHEVDDLEKTLQEISRTVKTSGKIMFIEVNAMETVSGPPLHIRIPSQKMKQLLEANHFTDIDIQSFNNDNYYVITGTRS
ncbi:class I SAM-dependent methyltransferase [Paraliobacillus ryukyuensis]|uniref:class I SAM-dependent methyltransferase n=1 Tax=Paraliobacillus ryukyuensis TaxID=200904 RepID=UPI0009A80F84|nr:class I SAM-dependent methyltransferase [Paraliobacillus ryukyuensis]